ncbi:hypothetical protein LOZ58_004896 [Ophidiomyces ophidiicola]|nr:hypothetical protein LOZ66_004973 [Ophidiomyces ophidiicola]KAI1958859.1 hypothetical protein LOZ58_004896 [Ophidiomyces ophidiicola]
MATALPPPPTTFPNFSLPTRRKPRKMTITQTYFLAHTARAKLSREASRPDHNLRLLVGHANMLDLLMLELSEAEREQERWFNHSVHGASAAPERQNKHIEWADTPVIMEEDEDWDGEVVSDSEEEDDDEDDEDDEEEYGNDDAFFVDITPTLTTSTTTTAAAAAESHPRPQHTYYHQQKQHLVHVEDEVDVYDDDDDDYEEDDQDDLADLALMRTHSHSQNPPELLADDSGDDDSEEDDAGPPSPPQPSFDEFSASSKHHHHHETGILLRRPRLYAPTAELKVPRDAGSKTAPPGTTPVSDAAAVAAAAGADGAHGSALLGGGIFLSPQDHPAIEAF